MRLLITGAAGFIGFHVAQRLLARGDTVVGVDNLGDATGVAIKRSRLRRLQQQRFTFIAGDVCDEGTLERAFDGPVEGVVHLAAQVGVRRSASEPERFVQANMVGFCKVIEAARRARVRHFVYASSSSVYGANRRQPLSERHPCDHPISFYGATKKANELVAHSYSQLHALATTGLRFFTAYGPWGRPDMAIFEFARRILDAQPIELYGDETLRRDFTYIDDIADAVIDVVDQPAQSDPTWDAHAPTLGRSTAPFRVLNVGSRTSVPVMQLITALEDALGHKAEVVLGATQPGDMLGTWADTEALSELLGPRAVTPLAVGVPRFVRWYLDEYRGRLDVDAAGEHNQR